MVTIKFGCQLPQETGNFEELVKIAETCEQLEYDSVWAYDHLSPYWIKRAQALECWTLLAAVAQRTKRIKLGTLVTNANLRHPALLAKVTSTFDVVSKGRLILGLGTGDSLSREELLSYGYNFAPVNERIQRLNETVMILKEMWTQSRTNFNGKYYTISDAVNLPKPVQKPHPPIWIGGRHVQLLDIVAQEADGWNYWGLDKKMLAHRSKYLAEKCAEIGRQPEQITKSWAGTLTKKPHCVGGRAQKIGSIAARLRRLTDAETTYFIAQFGSNVDSSIYETFAEAARSLQ